ncbi:MAG: glycosyl transferase [Elusimicrobia bacterium]|nr:glycosyl transferase [Elusimicrobiota bacterium]
MYAQRFKGLTQEQIRYILEIQFLSTLGYPLNLDNPKTFNEKIQWQKFYYHDPLMTKCADKVEAREYIKDVVGEKYLVPCLGVYNSVEEIDFNKLPNRFALKVNWGCKQNIICEDKSKLNIEEIKRKLKKWMDPHSNHYYNYFEWQYKDIKPKIICEQFVDCCNKKENIVAADYSVFCFQGKFKVFFVRTTTKTGNRYCNYYDSKLNLLDIKDDHPSDKDYKLGIDYNVMIELAEKLSKPFPQIRVDMYEDINKNLYIGELTFSHGNGLNAFNKDWDYKFGEEFILPEKKL